MEGKTWTEGLHEPVQRSGAEEWGIGGVSRLALRGLERTVRLDHGRAGLW